MSDDNDDDVAAIEAPPEVLGGPTSDASNEDDGPVYRRVVNDKTRTLFKDAASKLAKQIEDGDDDEVPAIPPPDDKPEAAAATASPGATQAVPPIAAAAAAPALDAATSRAALQLEVREKAVAEREKALEPYVGLREKYLDNQAGTLRDLIKEWTGAGTDEELKDEVADLISDLSSNVLGFAVSPEIKSRLDSRRAIRQVKSYKADITKREQQLAKKSEAEQQATREHRAMGALEVQLKAAAGNYPHLMAEDDAHAIVWDVIKTKASREPDWQPDWVEAAKLAEAHFKTHHEKQHQKLTRLFAPASKPAVEASNQGAPQSRGARTLTNAVSATAPVTPPAVLDDEPYDPQAHRRRSLDKLRARMKQDAQT